MAAEYEGLKIDGVPFVPATDLVRKHSESLSDHEVVSIAMALYLTCPDTLTSVDEKSKWRIYARARGVNRKITAKRS